MARNVDIILRAKDEATAQLRSFARSIDGLKSPVAALGAVAGAVGLVSIGNHLVGALKAATTAAEEQENAEAKLGQAIRKAGGDVETQLPALKAFTDRYQRIVGVFDETQLEGQALLVSLGGLRKEGIERVTKAALDMGAVTGDNEAAFKALGKASAGNFQQLQRLGIVLDENVPKSKRFEAALVAIEGKFGGQALAKAQTFAGQVKLVGVEFAELQETLGRKITESPAVRQILDALTKSIGGLNAEIQSADLEPLIRSVAISILDIAEAGLAGTKAFISLGGGVAVFFEALRGGDVEGTSRIFQRVNLSVDNLQEGIEHLQQRLSGDLKLSASQVAGSIRDVGSAATLASADIVSFRSVLTPANAILATVGVLSLPRAYAGLKSLASGALGFIAPGDKLGQTILRNESAMVALRGASAAQVLAFAGLTAAAFGVGWELGRLIGQTTGLDRVMRTFWDNWMHRGDDAAASIGQLSDDVDYLDRAAQALAKRGLSLQIDQHQIDQAKRAVLDFAESNSKGKLRIAADAQPLIFAVAQARQRVVELNKLAIELPQQFSTAAQGTVGPFRSLEDQVASVTARTREAAETAKALAPIPLTIAAIDEALKDLGVEGLEGAKSKVLDIQQAFDAVRDGMKAGLFPSDVGQARLEQIAKKALELERAGIHVDLDVRGVTTTNAALATTLQQLHDLRAELRSPLDLALRAAGVETLTKIKRDAENVDRVARELAKLETGPRTDEAEENIKRVRKELEGLAQDLLRKLPGIKLPSLDEGTRATVVVNTALEVSGGDKLGKLDEQIKTVLAGIDAINAAPVELFAPGEVDTDANKLVQKLAELLEQKRDLERWSTIPFHVVTTGQAETLRVLDQIDERDRQRRVKAVEDAGTTGRLLFEQEALYAERGASARIAAGNRWRAFAVAGVNEHERIQEDGLRAEIEILKRGTAATQAEEDQRAALIAEKEREIIGIHADAARERLALQGQFVAEMITTEQALSEAVSGGLKKLRFEIEAGRKVIQGLGADIKDALGRAGLRAVDDLANHIANIGRNQKSWKQFIGDMLRDLAAAIIRALLLKAITSAIGSLGFGGGAARTTALGPGGEAPTVAGSVPAVEVPNVVGGYAAGGVVKKMLDGGARAAGTSPAHDMGTTVRAAGGFLVTGGAPGKDSVPILATPGEAVLPKRLTDMLMAAAGATDRPIRITLAQSTSQAAPVGDVVAAIKTQTNIFESAFSGGAATPPRAASSAAADGTSGPSAAAATGQDAGAKRAEDELDAFQELHDAKLAIVEQFIEDRDQAEGAAVTNRVATEQAGASKVERHTTKLKKDEVKEATKAQKLLQEQTLNVQKQSFAQGKKLSYVSAVVNIAEGITKALAQGGGLGGIILGAIVAAAGAAQLAIISGAKFARGGVVPGAGTGDTVHALLTPGEFVVTKDLTALLLRVARSRDDKPVVVLRQQTDRTAERSASSTVIERTVLETTKVLASTLGLAPALRQQQDRFDVGALARQPLAALPQAPLFARDVEAAIADAAAVIASAPVQVHLHQTSDVQTMVKTMVKEQNRQVRSGAVVVEATRNVSARSVRRRSS